MIRGIDLFDDFIGDPRYSAFAAIAEPLDQQMRALVAEAEIEEGVTYDCIAGGDHGDAKVHAVAAHAKITAAHELGKEIDRTARTILRAEQSISSTYLGKLPETPARKAFIRLHRNPGLTPAEQEPFLTIITLSPDGPAYAVLVSERVLRRPWKAAEPIIATSTEHSFLSASIHRMPFLAGEAAISRSRKLWKRYQSRHGLSSSAAPRCTACGGHLRNGSCDKNCHRTAGATA